ncbi:MAG: PxKF domain-containing protein [Anaerolineae bacterium]
MFTSYIPRVVRVVARQTSVSRVCLYAFLVAVAFAAVLAVGQPAHAGSIVYVVPGGTGAGTSWSDGKDLSAALAGAGSGDELWVKAGTYKPTTGADRSATFTIKNGVAVYGGFAGTETTRAQRNPTTNVTTLSGDLAGDDGPNFTNNTDNSYHVVTANLADSTAVLDGFTIKGGNASDFGAGMYNNNGSPTLANVTFSGNFASGQGGAMWNIGDATLTNVVFMGNSSVNGGGAMLIVGNPTLTNVTFTGNSSNGSGGAILNLGDTPTFNNVTFNNNSSVSDGGGVFNNGSSPILTNVTFSGNTALDGGGMANNTITLTLINVVFSGNSANGVNANTGFGGGMYSNGGTATLTNVVFSGNFASNGGGLANNGSNPVLTNVTMSGNKASGSGGGMYSAPASQYAPESTPVVRNSIFWGDVGGEIFSSGATVTYSDVQQASGVYAGTGNINADPKFISSITTAAPTTTGDLHLQDSSPAINVGNNAVTNPSLPATDLDGGPRIAFGTVDLGAYEVGDKVPPSVTLNPAANGCALNGNNGWCRGMQTAGFTASDAGSGVASPCSGATCNFTQTSTTNGSGVTIASGLVCDTSNNCNPGILAGPFKIDSNAPTLNPTISPNPPILGGTATASPNATDTLSGVASQSCDAVDTSSVGPKTLTCRATDAAGNSTSSVVSYTVGYRLVYTSPTLAPPGVNNLYVSGAGTTYTPVKWRLTNAAGTAITAAGLVAAVRFAPPTTCGGTIPTYSDSLAVAGGFSSTNPRYDTLQGVWLFNWQLPSAKGCYTLYIRLNSGDVLTALYRLN